MNNLAIKTGEEIKKRMLFWFLKYHNQSVDEFYGNEQFTLFDKIESNKKEFYLGIINLIQEELPVFILTVDINEVIINTSNRFVRLTDKVSESINYIDFEWHNGFKNFVVDQTESDLPVSVKNNGFISEFGIRKRNGEIVYWNIPTGKSGYAFWNVTKKCELIGRKYNQRTKDNIG